MHTCKSRIPLSFLYSKKRKWLEAIWKYWLEKAQSFELRSDEGADTDGQDELDHGVHPTDKNVETCHKKNKVKVSVCLFVVLPVWNGRVWTVNVVEVSNHTCWPSVVWAVNMTKNVCWPGY